MKSETFRAIQEDNMGYVDNRVHEVPQPVQTKVFQPNKMVGRIFQLNHRSL